MKHQIILFLKERSITVSVNPAFSLFFYQEKIPVSVSLTMIHLRLQFSSHSLMTRPAVQYWS